MFIGVYFAACGLQYLIIMIVSLILIRRKVAGNLRQVLLHYTALALGISFLGLVLFSLVSIPVGNLHFNLPQDFTDPQRLLANLPKILTALLGLIGVTAPIWTLLLAIPRQPSH